MDRNLVLKGIVEKNLKKIKEIKNLKRFSFKFSFGFSSVFNSAVSPASGKENWFLDSPDFENSLDFR